MTGGEKVIAVMGPTGVGKSSFIHNSVPPHSCAKVKVGHSLESQTDEVQPVCWVTEDGTKVKLVDTPGFDDSRADLTDVQVLKMIATFLTEKHGENSQLTGLVYVHRISDTRVGGSSRRNLRMFRKLCGTDSLKNVVIVTTMWDKVTPEEGLQREQELMLGNNLFKPLLDGGAIMMRHERTVESATKVINHLLGKKVTTTQIVREIIQEKKELEYTAAGGELHSEIEALLKRHKEEMETLTAELEAVREDPAEERRRMEQVITTLLSQLNELRRGINVAPIGNDPPPVYEFIDNFPAPETKCIVHCSKVLQLVEAHEPSLAPAHTSLLRTVTNRIKRLAEAVEKSVKGVQHGSTTLKSALESENMRAFQQFMQVDPHPRTFTHGAWAKARHDIEIVANEIEIALLSNSRARWPWNGNQVKQALNAFLVSTTAVVADMELMEEWWTTVINALGNVEDAARHRCIDDNAVVVALNRIIRAMDSYCEAYGRCSDELHKVARELSLKY